jgi:glutathione S-transferase
MIRDLPTMSYLRPIELYYQTGRPNPIKVRIILEELDLPYEVKMVASEDIKASSYTHINLNGRLPSIVDNDGPQQIIL